MTRELTLSDIGSDPVAVEHHGEFGVGGELFISIE